jgi:HSP20 family molecular chaperone IbpA
MHPATISLMYEQARAIYRAITGSDLPDEPEGDGHPADSSFDVVAQRFADLEAMARQVSAVVEHVPPFSFVPPVDAFEDGKTLVVEVAVSGVEQADVTVERFGDDLLVVSGVRRRETSNGRSYLHAEIPRGPFHRAIQLPYAVSAEPRVEVRSGLIRIELTRIRGLPE